MRVGVGEGKRVQATCAHHTRKSSWTQGVEVQFVLVAQHANVESDAWAGSVISSENGASISSGDTDASSLLDLFNTWHYENLQSGALVANDNHILLTARDFSDSTVGLAGVTTMRARLEISQNSARVYERKRHQ